ncbi:MAG TPA: hypothetical protein VN922_16905 [Bacteroidia bacterium]|nr:hypothetical protein [Bacteroidia bacterium]
MEAPTRSQNIIITTILFYLVVIIFPGEIYSLPMVVNVITELTNLLAEHSKPSIMYGGLPLAAIMILIIATSERMRRKDLLYVLAVCMLAPSVLHAFKENRAVNGWSIMTLSVVPFCVIVAVGFAYFILKWVRRYMRD